MVGHTSVGTAWKQMDSQSRETGFHLLVVTVHRAGGAWLWVALRSRGTALTRMCKLQRSHWFFRKEIWKKVPQVGAIISWPRKVDIHIVPGVRHLEAEDDVVGGEPELGDVVVAEALDPLARVRTPRREPTVLPVFPVLVKQSYSVN